jgi:hypothetical protein
MVYTVWSAFNRFRTDTVDLAPDVTDRARTSRNYLFDQVKRLANNNADFPRLKGGYLSFGSFARKTKIQPLDDVDILILLNDENTEVQSLYNEPYTYYLKAKNSFAPLYLFTDDYNYVNSTKILNKIKYHLSSISNYKKAEIKKTMQAVTLNLSSYDWVFDIVPAVPAYNYSGSIAYYLIPDGKGKWIKTDPRVDSTNVTKINSRHNGKFLPTLRLLKYWNRRTHKPRLQSYYFETLAIQVFQYATSIENFPNAIKYFFDNCPFYINQICSDPKNLGTALDLSVPQSTIDKIITAMSEASTFAKYALVYEEKSDNKEAIYWWQRIFGYEFPSYG